ncbi:hypothetical protein L3X38_003483 [Prunus dulcis]|uniref:Non-ATPase subunit 9 n=1 Tax=Prunus dulcis TaxID=3755 RepID=A0AAD4ZM67_PRUDU|nr:hypothetical protein L3X38_003483 [Prunus dulcis]
MHCFQTRLKISIYQRKLFVFFPCQSTVRVSHRLPLVFFVVSELKHSVFLLLSLHAKEKEILFVKMVSQHQSKDSGSKKNGGKELGMAAPQEKSSKKMKFAKHIVKRKLQKLRPIVEVPLVDMKWSQIPKDIKEQIWEAVDMAFVKWKDFKSTLTRHYILPYTNDREKLSQPPETYKFIEKAQWDAFVASRLSKDFESVHSQHAQIREKLEYNHRLSRK